eukprot:gene14942-614_t
MMLVDVVCTILLLFFVIVKPDGLNSTYRQFIGILALVLSLFLLRILHAARSITRKQRMHADVLEDKKYLCLLDLQRESD